MTSKKRLLRSWKVYAILDDGLFPDRRQMLRKFAELLESPVDVVQLRFKDITELPVYRAAEEMAEAAREKNVPLIINDRPEMALSLGADGVHLGKCDIPASVAREMLGAEAIIGRTIRGRRDLEFIDERDVDYVAIGPVFSTPLKPDLKPVSRSRLRELCGNERFPLVAIGGINTGNAAELAARGIRTVAFARYGITGKDTRKRIEELRRIMTERAG